MLTTKQFQTLDDLYAFYNVKLFGASLPECIVNLSRRPHSYGFFVANLWATMDNTMKPNEYSHEISLNPDYLLRPSIEWHSTLVHEMVHLWQQEFGKPSRVAYHNKQWAEKMESIGLIPSDTGMPGGAKTGQSVSQYINPDGRFAKVFNSLDAAELEMLRLRYLPVASITSSREKDQDDDPDDPNSSAAGRKKKKIRRSHQIFMQLRQ
ncbi:MAG: SprT-like domain-containing protein [Tannerella sp.]|jgi:hypothetical protein|nr:SprT-like domain-containing protein [Tannerella sp.]